MLCVTLALNAVAADTTVGDFTYKLNKTDKIARLTGRAKDPTKAYNLTIPTTIKYNDVTYKVISVQPNAFSGDVYIRKLTIGDNVETIGKGAFSNTGVTSVASWGKKLQTIGDEAFAHSNIASAANIPATVLTIGDLAFGDCTELTALNFTVPAKITSIGKQAFWNCKKLTAIALPGSLQTIGDECFKICEGLTSVAFLSGTGKTYVGQKCFDNLKNISKVTFGEPSVGQFGASCFINCGIESLALPSSCTQVGEAAFASNRLTELRLNEGLKIIDPYAFESQYSANGISELVIPSTVQKIGDKAFVGVGSKMTSITSRATTPPDAVYGAFSDYNQQHTPLYVPEAALSTYKFCIEWSDFRYIYGIGAGIDDVAADSTEAGATPVRWYDLQGHEIDPDNAAPGIYIRRQGTEATKVAIH